MEVNAANVARHKKKKKIGVSQVSSKKLKNKKKKSSELSAKERQAITGNAIPVTTKNGMSLNDKKLLSFPYERRDFTHTYLNVREWVASTSGFKFSKPTEEMSKQKLDVFFCFVLFFF